MRLSCAALKDIYCIQIAHVIYDSCVCVRVSVCEYVFEGAAPWIPRLLESEYELKEYYFNVC